MIHWLDATVGWELAEKAYASLHLSHFVEAGLLNDLEVLSEAAVAAGVDAKLAVEYLRGDEGAEAILGLAEDVHARGIHSIPALFVDGQPALSGAAGKEDVLHALREAAANATGARQFVRS